VHYVGADQEKTPLATVPLLSRMCICTETLSTNLDTDVRDMWQPHYCRVHALSWKCCQQTVTDVRNLQQALTGGSHKTPLWRIKATGYGKWTRRPEHVVLVGLGIEGGVERSPVRGRRSPAWGLWEQIDSFRVYRWWQWQVFQARGVLAFFLSEAGPGRSRSEEAPEPSALRPSGVRRVCICGGPFAEM
jgi:hypothetical protein